MALDGKIMAVPVPEGAYFSSGTPVALFQGNQRTLIATSELLAYDVSQDGQRFLINTHVNSGEVQPMSVELNWDVELKKK